MFYMKLCFVLEQGPAQQYPVDNSSVGPAPRLRTIIDKQDDFSQAGARYRYYDSARQVIHLMSTSSHNVTHTGYSFGRAFHKARNSNISC
jgi:hypothetical protein